MFFGVFVVFFVLFCFLWRQQGFSVVILFIFIYCTRESMWRPGHTATRGGQESVFSFHLSVGSLPLCNKSPAEPFRWLSWTEPGACHSSGQPVISRALLFCVSPDVITYICFLQEDEEAELRSSRCGASALPDPSDQPLRMLTVPVSTAQSGDFKCGLF